MKHKADIDYFWVGTNLKLNVEVQQGGSSNQFNVNLILISCSFVRNLEDSDEDTRSQAVISVVGLIRFI